MKYFKWADRNCCVQYDVRVGAVLSDPGALRNISQTLRRITALPVSHHILSPGLELTLELQPAFDHLR
jgi:hypothetical protein